MGSMKGRGLISGVNDFAQQQSLLPDLRRATRTTAAFMAPLLLAHFGIISGPVTFAAIAAQNVAMMDVRGPYRVRVSLLLAKTVILGGATWIGFTASGSLLGAVLATALIAMFMGVWRHFSTDYGPSLAAGTALLFLIALAATDTPPGLAVLYALGGGLGAVLIQAALWPFRPEHPLRQTAAESWVALGDLFAAMSFENVRGGAARHQAIVDQEANVRTTLDRTTALLAAGAEASPLRRQLEALDLTAARIATRVVVFNGALEALRDRPEFPRLTSIVQPVLTSLTNTSRTVALALVSRQPSHLATCEVRVQRLENLIETLRARLTVHAAQSPGGAELADLLRHVAEQLPPLLQQLRATMERSGERGAFSLELFDLDAWSLRPLAASLNFSHRIDASLVRFTARLAVLMMIGVAIFEYWQIPRGYWLPLTVVVVLQPDYGSTRLRAAQRLLGTLVGSVLASLLLWLKLPAVVLLVAIAVTIFGFSYYLRKNYAVAVFFVTLMVVLLTEASSSVTIAFTLERLIATMAGGTMAMLAAILFWPVWEWQRFPSFLAAAIRANKKFLGVLESRLASGGSYDAEAVAAKRAAETANATVFASLQRMAGDPKRQQNRLAQAAALANGNQRLTRALTTIALHLTPGTPLTHPDIVRFSRLASEALEAVANHIASPQASGADLESLLAALESFQTPLAEPGESRERAEREQWVFGQLSRVALELSAMLVSARKVDSLPTGNSEQK
ncbi:MAG: rane protein [Verrucomicrobia bacterium]|nr:rane protein [Verrucomicrobiota bacterium]